MKVLRSAGSDDLVALLGAALATAGLVAIEPWAVAVFWGIGLMGIGVIRGLQR